MKRDKSLSTGKATIAGAVVFYSDLKGYGYIRPNGSDENIFVHKSTLELSGLSMLADGQLIEFKLSKDAYGRSFITNIVEL